METKTPLQCVVCNGTGTIYDPHCTVPDCNTAFTEGQMSWMYAQPAKFLPCGHRFRFLKEQSTCPDCQGTGKIER